MGENEGKSACQVISPWGHPTGERVPNKVCVELLEEWLDRARAGEVIGVVLVGLAHDGCGQWSVGGRLGGYSVLGALEVARQELVEIVRDE